MWIAQRESVICRGSNYIKKQHEATERVGENHAVAFSVPAPSAWDAPASSATLRPGSSVTKKIAWNVLALQGDKLQAASPRQATQPRRADST